MSKRRGPSKKSRARHRRAAQRHQQPIEKYRTAKGLRPDGTDPGTRKGDQ